MDEVDQLIDKVMSPVEKPKPKVSQPKKKEAAKPNSKPIEVYQSE